MQVVTFHHALASSGCTTTMLLYCMALDDLVTLHQIQCGTYYVVQAGNVIVLYRATENSCSNATAAFASEFHAMTPRS